MTTETDTTDEEHEEDQQKTPIKTYEGDDEPEYVGAYSRVVDADCANYRGEYVEDIEMCGDDATHTVVMFDGDSLAEIPMCDDCGEPEDVVAHDREWSGEVTA